VSRADEIRGNLESVEARIRSACERSGRRRDEVTLVAVTKTFPAGDVDHAVRAGVADVGENRVQEAREKQTLVASPVRWHLIGHLQSNKARDAARLFDVVQSVDSASLAEKLARAADAAEKRLTVYLQVNVGGEEQKSGAAPADAAAIARAIRALPSLDLAGLMTIPPIGEAEAMRPYFRRLRSMRDDLGAPGLSMGMTDDFEIAIEEGATVVRVGRAIFGARG
jgi:pyridoxal phosphate enzyme (YggS family)